MSCFGHHLDLDLVQVQQKISLSREKFSFMSYFKPSNLLMTCLLSAKTGFLLISPVNATSAGASSQTLLSSPIEVEVVNLRVNSNARTGDLILVADADYDQTDRKSVV